MWTFGELQARPLTSAEIEAAPWRGADWMYSLPRWLYPGRAPS